MTLGHAPTNRNKVNKDKDGKLIGYHGKGSPEIANIYKKIEQNYPNRIKTVFLDRLNWHKLLQQKQNWDICIDDV